MPLMKLREPHAGNVLLTIGITNCVCCGKLLDNAYKKKTPTKGNLYFLFVFMFLFCILYLCFYFVFCIFYLYLCFYFVFCILYFYLCFLFCICILYFLFIIYSSTSSIFKSVSFTVNSRGFK